MIHFFRRYWDAFRASYWFVPSLMASVAIALSLICVELDQRYSDDVMRGLGWTYAGGAAGAREVLSTIASAMITVAGVTFSILIVALSLASQQFGPRLLRNFMRDVSNQVTLGTFTSTYLYCLLVLRTVQGRDDAVNVPHLSITVAVILAVVGVGVLIYFIHHAAESIQVSHLLQRVSEDLDGSIDRLYPEKIGEGSEEHSDLPPAPPDDWPRVTSAQTGYIHSIDGESLIEAAEACDAVIWVLSRPGDFVIEGMPLLAFSRADRMDDSLTEKSRNAFSVARHRTTPQDAGFGIRQLVEVALRALSPSLNDPFTAIQCIDRLTAALWKLAHRRIPSPYRKSEGGAVRLVSEPFSHQELVQASLAQIVDASREHQAVLDHLRKSVNLLLERAQDPEMRSALRKQAAALRSP